MEAFCYSISDHSNGKIYIGWHLGDINDGYFCSSKELLEEYKNRPGDFSRQVIATGNREDMFALETTILSQANAMHDNTYYNKSNNFGRKCSNPTAKTFWWNNGKSHKRSIKSPGHGWVKGRIGLQTGGAIRHGPHSKQTKEKISNWRKKNQFGKNNPNWKGDE